METQMLLVPSTTPGGSLVPRPNRYRCVPLRGYCVENTVGNARSLLPYFLLACFPRAFTILNRYMYRLSYERRGDISFIARETISYFVTSERSERGTKYDIVTRAIKLILPSLEYDNLFITYLCLYLEQKPDYIFKLFTLRVHFKMNSK